MEYQKHVLPNGIRIIHRRVNGMVANLGVILNTGSRDELDGEQGIAHFIEHTIFKGTSKRKAYHILSRLDDVGADMNAFTTKEEICIYASFLKEHYGRTIELFADITMNSVFPEKEIEKEKDVVIDEINSYRDNPSEEIFDQIEEIVFDGHPMGNNILGTKEIVAGYNREKIRNFIKRTFHTDQIVICSVGDMDFGKLVKTLAKYFGEMEQNLRDFKRIAIVDYSPKIMTERKANHQGHCIIANRAYSITDEKRAAFIVANNIFGGPGMNSRLNLNIREKYGFCYNIESNYSIYSDTGIFTTYLGTEFEYIDKTIKLVEKEMKALKDNILGTLQLHKAKQQIKGQIAISSENNVNELLGMGKSILAYDKVDTLEDIYSKIDSITAHQILEVTNEVFDQKMLTYLIYGKI